MSLAKYLVVLKELVFRLSDEQYLAVLLISWSGRFRCGIVINNLGEHKRLAKSLNLIFPSSYAKVLEVLVEDFSSGLVASSTAGGASTQSSVTRFNAIIFHARFFQPKRWVPT